MSDEKRICGKCENEITGKYITAMDKTWCDGHFTCAGEDCDSNLEGTPFYEREEKPFCKDCFAKKFANVCNGCKEPIVGKTVTAMKTTWHTDCFVCKECKKPLQGKPFFEKNGEPWCQEDFEKSRGFMCKSCGKCIGATEKVVTAMDAKFHQGCFNCANCKEDFGGKSFYVKNGEPWCEKCSN